MFFPRNVSSTILLSGLLMLSGCEGMEEMISGNAAPTPGDGGAIRVGEILRNSITISWERADDDATAPDSLEYLVLVSASSNDIDTLAHAIRYAETSLPPNWIKNLTTATVADLSTDTLYYFNIIIRDEAGSRAIYTMRSQKTTIDLNSCVIAYHFNGNPEEATNSNYNLTWTGAPGYPDWSASDQAARFTGTNYLGRTVPANDPLQVTTELTISVWVKLEDPSVDQKIAGKIGIIDGARHGFMLGVLNGRLYPIIYDTRGVMFSFFAGEEGAIPADTATHVALTWKSGGELCAYINGVRYGIDVLNVEIGHADNSTFRIGAAPWDTNIYRVKGEINDLRIYAQELMDYEIQALYNSGPR